MLQRHSEPDMMKQYIPVIKLENMDNLSEETLLLANGDSSFMQPVSLPSKVDLDGEIVENQSLLTGQELYNILTAETWMRQPHLNKPNYLLLLDCR